MRRLATGLAALAATMALALAAGFIVFVEMAHQPAQPAPIADGIVALTGGADRVETALRLLEAGNAKLLLVSGVAPGASLHDLARRVGLDAGPLAARVTLGRSARTTLGNAEEAADWAREHDLHSLIIVTAGYHMPRAMLEMRRSMPAETFYALPVQPVESPRFGKVRLLAGEYVKLIAAWFGVSRVIRQPLALVHRTPVDKSVNG